MNVLYLWILFLCYITIKSIFSLNNFQLFFAEQDHNTQVFFFGEMINIIQSCLIYFHQHKKMFLICMPEEEKVVASKPLTATKKLKSKKRRVVVTGMGVVSPLGHDVEEFYGNILRGVSGVSHIEAFDCSDFPTVNKSYLFFFTFSCCEFQENH